ncbi:MAG: hypothetical protein FGM14_00135 [Flavobacteriales bacterium]|nr:hypothetical protein [Flavobacteriales bacterium]
MYFFRLLILFFPLFAFAQENCEFKHHNRKGGSYLFSIYYESDLQTPLNGTCESRYRDNRIYEKRTFIDGKLQLEELNYESGKTIFKLNNSLNKKDSIIGTLEMFWPNGNRKQTNIYYWDKNHRRCEKYTDYHINGKVRFENFIAFARISEIDEYQLKDYPPHTIDYDGYTTLRVPFGTALEYDDAGVLKSKTNHKMILNGGHQHSSKDGVYEEYHHNGKLKTIGFYKEGNPDGNWVIYNFLGTKIEEQFYQRNMKIGTWKGWYDNGKPRFEYVYDTLSNFIFNPNKKEWNEAGILTFQREIDRKGTGFEKKWNDKGVLIQYIELTNNSKELGLEKNWYPSGQLKSFLNNQRNSDTTYVSYFPNGKMEEIHLKSKNNEEELISNMKWNEAGVLISSVSKKTNSECWIFESFDYWTNGKKKKHIHQLKETRLEENYFQNGTLKNTFRTINGKYDGKSEQFDSLGTLIQAYNFKENLRNGWCKRYDKTGKLIFAQYYEMGCLKKMPEEIPAKKRTFSELSKAEQDQFRSLVYNNLMRHFHPDSLQLIYTKQQIDSLATNYMYVYDFWSKNAAFLPSSPDVITGQIISFRLPAVYLTELNQKDTSNKYVKEILKAFEKNGWNVTNLKLENGYFNWDLEVNGFYTQKFIQTHFPLLKTFIYILPNSKNVQPLETTFRKRNRDRPLTIYRFSDCVYQASISSYDNTFHFLIYPDGEVDLLNGATLEDLNEVNDFSRELPYD